MKRRITLREAVTDKDIALFWEQLYGYFEWDIFPDPKDEKRERFLHDSEYRIRLQQIHDRPQDRCYYLFFYQEGRDIGFVMPAIYTTEDGKCFILEFCVYPEFRGRGMGRECVGALLDWAREHGALYAELNCDNKRRIHFWESAGFIKNGADEWGEPLMILPPEENIPITIEVLSDPGDWQLRKLKNGLLAENGKEPLTEIELEKLQQAVQERNLTFFMAKRGYRAVGMCSVRGRATLCDRVDANRLDDFFIEPAFRGKGIERLLTQAVHTWCGIL